MNLIIKVVLTAGLVLFTYFLFNSLYRVYGEVTTGKHGKYMGWEYNIP